MGGMKYVKGGITRRIFVWNFRHKVQRGAGNFEGEKIRLTQINKNTICNETIALVSTALAGQGPSRVLGPLCGGARVPVTPAPTQDERKKKMEDGLGRKFLRQIFRLFYKICGGFYSKFKVSGDSIYYGNHERVWAWVWYALILIPRYYGTRY